MRELSSPQVDQSARCKVRELAIRELAYPRVVQLPPQHVSGINFLVLSINLIPVPLSLTCLFMLLLHLHIFLLSQLTTLTVRKSLYLSLPAQDRPFSQIFPTIDSLPSSGLTPWLYDWTVSSEHLGFYFQCLH